MVLDATWLFERPGRKSEQWWTSLASMLLIFLARHDSSASIPLWRYEATKTKWKYERCGVFGVGDAAFSTVMVEQSLAARAFPGVPPWPTTPNLNPDILIYRPDVKRVRIIENKTERARVGRLAPYAEAAKHLRDHGWDAILYVLISPAHPDNLIWSVVQQYALEILFWEDLLRLCDQIECFRSLFDEDLKQYYEGPALEGDF